MAKNSAGRAAVITVAALAMGGAIAIITTRETVFLLIPSAVLLVLTFMYDWLRARETEEDRHNSWSISRWLIKVDNTKSERRRITRIMSLIGMALSIFMIIVGFAYSGDTPAGYVVVWGGCCWLAIQISLLLHVRRVGMRQGRYIEGHGH